MKSIIFIQHHLSPVALKRLDYVIDFINDHPLKPTTLWFTTKSKTQASTIINYGTENESDYFVPATFSLFANQNSPLFSAIRYPYKNTFIHGIGRDDTRYFYEKGRFGFDLFSTIFFHISRYEEVHASTDNESSSGWIEETQHFLVKNQLAQIPVADILLTAFFESLSGKKINTPTSFSLSHDLDLLYRFTPKIKFLRSIAATFLRGRIKKDLKNNSIYFWKMITDGKRDPYDYFEELLKEESIWKDKCLYLMAGGNTVYDNKYSIGHPKILEIIKLARSRGYSIGLHPSYNAGFDHSMLAEEKSRLEKIVGEQIVDNRQHWLRWSWEITPFLLEKNGFKNDSSMGYKHRLGFRCGTGFGYRMYNFKEERSFKWKEYPLILMDSAGMHFSDGNGLKAIEVMKNFINKNKYNTAITMNFHNSNFDPLTEEGKILRAYYEALG